MVSRISCIAHNFRHVERPLGAPYWLLHTLSQTVWPKCGSVKRVSGPFPGSAIPRKYASESASRQQDFRYITFPKTRKGKRAEREAYEYWASLWKPTDQVKKPLIFKIDDRNLSGTSGLINVTREGIVFPAGDRRGEGYWRLDHPLSLSAKLQLSRNWLYGGPSLPLSAKIEWLMTGPSPQPWSERSRWIRWPIYGLFFTLLLASILIERTREQVALTGRWRISLHSDSQYEERMKTVRRSGLEKFGYMEKAEPLAEPQFSRVNGIMERILIACGLEKTVRQIYLVGGKGKHDITRVPLVTQSYLRLSAHDFANAF